MNCDFRCIFGSFIRNLYLKRILELNSKTVKHYKGLLLLFLLVAFYFVQGQTPTPCHWSFKVEQTQPDEATLIITAKLDSGWHLYSQHLTGDGPIPTKFNFNNSSDYKLTGETEEGKPMSEYDKNFDLTLKYFEHEAVFTQKIKVLGKKDFTIAGTIDYMVCMEQCLFPPAKEFSFQIKGNIKGEDSGDRKTHNE
jgi:Thiol:disulfide interchange protein DsbD, N-terminal